MDLIYMFRTFRPNAEKYTFFLSAHRTLSCIDHILGHKSSLNKFQKILSSIFSDYDTMRLDMNYREKTAKKHKLMEIKQYITK